MKNNGSDNLRHWELFIGIAIGMGLGVMVFVALIPSGLDMIRLYNLKNEGFVNKNTKVMNYATTTIFVATSTDLDSSVQSIVK